MKAVGFPNVAGPDASRRFPLAAITGALPLGGSSTFLVNLSAAMHRRGYALPVIVLSMTNDYSREFSAMGNPVEMPPHRRLIYEDRLQFCYEMLARFQPGLVLGCLGGESFEPLRVVPPGVARFGVVQSDDPGPYGLARSYASWLDGVIGVSAEICRRLQALPELAGKRIEHIPYGIDFISPPPVRGFDPKEPLRVIYVGRLIEEQKRVSRLAELVQRVQQRCPDVEFTFVGSGPEEAWLCDQLAGRSGVQLLGALPYDQVVPILKRQDVFILLSDYEGLPLSLLEAMGYGVVPIASDLPSGVREVVDTSRGFRVPVGDVSAAAAVVLQLREDRSALGERSRAAVSFVRENYSADRMAERYLALWSSVPRAEVQWPVDVTIPVPLGVERPWLFRGFMRTLRRKIKRLVG